MSEFKYWITVWSIVVIPLLGVVGLIFYTNYVDNKAIESLVSKGAKPIEAACAIRPGEVRCIAFYANTQPQVIVVK